ncbi:ATP-binding protein [Azorhizobium doebereinerae]|uniref:ATP-binding protein n=1 Tax=Azorhizobium doebereinerae TaxID=281091 RepID=UPI0004018BCF|nr:ATP-binding protein [Azorhizobium doebereinerae]
MMRLWTRSLAARFICFTLFSLILSQAVVFFISWDEHGQAMRKSAKGEMLSRSTALVRVLEATPPELQTDILAASSSMTTRYWVTAEVPQDAATWRLQAWSHLSEPLPRLPMHGYMPPALEPRIEPPRNAAEVGSPEWLDMPPAAWPLARAARFVYLDNATGMGLTVRLENGSWLNIAFAKPQESFWNAQTITSFAISALVLSVLAVFAARGIARPLRRLARAAEALGRGQQIDRLPETGPDDIRQTAEAFNRMQERLVRFVEDRTRMLAAIGHDLRTPLTSLRLRAEFIADDEVREKILSTVTEIQSMCEATLAFVREEGAAEETRTVDLTALVESLCEDLAELGHKVTFEEAPKLGYHCRPAALRRACRNLVENAVRYGECARVRIEHGADGVAIIVEDDGPGIPEADHEHVFAPFFRLENSRNRETGGVGLGLAIARTIVRHHGGDVGLANGATGLRVTLTLPAVNGDVGQNLPVAPSREGGARGFPLPSSPAPSARAG